MFKIDDKIQVKPERKATVSKMLQLGVNYEVKEIDNLYLRIHGCSFWYPVADFELFKEK